MKWYCWHDWPKWSKIVNAYAAPFQYRACTKCNKVAKRRAAFTGNEVNLVVWNTDTKEGET